MQSYSSPLPICCSLVILAGCAAAPALVSPTVPTALQPPSDQALYLEALATGVQVYECSQKSDASYEWAFKAPEASLASRSGQSLGKHYAGPTWESVDGSKVVGEVKAREPGPNTSAISWLLLAAKPTSSTGMFGATKSIQRVATVGGIAPAGGCTGTNLKEVARVPYTATYYFYR
jgi:Protein of unknown function (DUF3455)